MYRASLILIAALVLSIIGLGNALAADVADGSMDTLSAYLHGHSLPLVEARMITDGRGERSLLLYGYVATPYGKSDAEDQARDFLDDPDVEIVNRIKVKPELLTLGTPTDNSNAGTEEQPAADTAQGDSDSADQTAAQTQDFPDVIGDREAYANQERDPMIGGMPLALVILGSGSIFPPIVPYPIYNNRLPSPFGSPPVVVSSPPIFVMRPPFSPPPTTFRGFRPAFGPGISPFPAGPAPMFPATGGTPPFVTTINPGFGGFARPGFAVHGGFGGGGFGGGGFRGGGFGGGGFRGGGFGGHR
jgi:uncharacterized membrane protein YgcG